MQPLKHILSQIAGMHLRIPTLEVRKSDGLDFHNVSVWDIETALKAAFDAGRTSAEPEDIDIEAVLRQRKQVAAIWSVEDVQGLRPDLSEEQAFEVLEEVSRKHDAEYGINWTTLECMADILFPKSADEEETRQ